MERYLKLNDGTILSDSQAYDDGNGLNVIIGDKSLDILQTILLLSNKENTKRIIYHYYKAELVFDGYTKLVSVRDEGTIITVTLKKEDSDE
jgi:hypothetical protein